MVGLKTFWILISTLFLLAACVPQTKQTECGANEAFNASLRTCVPVVGGPSSFINISSFVPQFTQSRQKDDATTLTFTIAVSNPYNQSYSIEWARVFNAAEVTMCSNALSCSFSASLLGTTLGEVGTHILTAKVKDGNGSVVDSHAFEIKVNDFPKPVINSASLTPSSYAFDALPSDPRIPFSFSIRNNNATLNAGDNYRTIWTIVKNGSVLLTESDSFTNFAPTGTNTAYFGVSPTSAFNPATLGVGSYIVRATVQNDIPGEIVAEQQWNVIIKDPDLANVTTIGQPAPGVTITAHNNVDRNDFPTLSWIYSGTTQPNFCVTVDDRDGTYAGDGDTIQVRWYLDGLGGDICTKETLDTPGSQTICLIDANNCDPGGANLPFDQDLLQFANANSTSAQTHKVTARLFDEATSAEFQRSDVVPSNGSYPIEWVVNNKPANTAPVMGFGTAATNPTGCVSGGANTRSSCAVNQGTNFTVSFTAADDFWSPAGTGNPEEFQWDVKLKYNGADITSPDVTKNTSCSKAFGTAVTLPVANTTGYGTTQWTCTLAVPHYTSSGPLNPSVGTYQVIASMQDQVSPVGGAALISTNLTWNLVVTETNPSGIVLAAQTNLAASSNVTQGGTVLDPAVAGSFATEGQSVAFRLNVTDSEQDDFKYKVSLCTDNTASCATSVALTTPLFVDFFRNLLPVPTVMPVSSLTYTIPEDFLMSKFASAIDINTSTSQLVHFKVEVEDVPSVPATVEVLDTEIFSFHVRNLNPAPVIDTATASPDVGTTSTVFSGYQFTIDPGTVTDPSGPAVERNLQYQWYAKIGAGAWSAITGATSEVLRYTPGNSASNIDLKLCVGDGTAAHPVSSTGTCSANWTVIPKTFLNNLLFTDAAGVAAGSINNEMAVWYDEFNAVANTQIIYSAYVDSNDDIFVEKTIKDASNNVILSTSAVRFPALDTVATGVVTNLSMTGTADSLYIAYVASPSAAPTTMSPYVRRLDISGLSKLGLPDAGTFGFQYDAYNLTATCPGTTTCTVTNADGVGGSPAITFSNAMEPGDSFDIAGELFTANAGVGTNDVCNNTNCSGPNSMASNVANKINNSTIPALQGIRAVASGATVSFEGQWNDDYIDFDGSIAGIPGLVVSQGGLGKIFILNGSWHLPFINASLAGAQQNNITVLTGAVDVHMRTSAPNTNEVLTELGKVAAFDHDQNAAGEMVIASISSDIANSGKMQIGRYVESAGSWAIFNHAVSAPPTDDSQMDIFPTFDFEYVKLAASKTGNPHYYVIAREKTVNGAEYHMGRFDPNLDSAVASLEHVVTTRLITTDSTQATIDDAKLKFPTLLSVPGFAEARIFFHSVGGSTIPLPRIARWKSDDTITCGGCASLSGALEFQPGAAVGVSQIANNLTLGEIGGLSGENINDVVFTLYATDLTSTDVFRPQLGIVNIEAESIQSTTTDATGRWHPPFVLD